MSESYEIYKNRYDCQNTININKNGLTANDRTKALKLLKDQIWASTNLVLKDKSFCSDDNFLASFLYAKKFQCGEAFKLLLKYLSFKTSNRDLLKNMNIFDEKIQMAIRDGNPRVLKQRDRKGRKIITFAAANWDPNKYTLIDVFRAFLISIDTLLENVQNQALGFVVIVDWTDFHLNQSIHINPKMLKFIINGLQECIPAKFKGVHFISQPWFVDFATTLIRNFLNEKSKRRLVVHGSNLATLHNFINKDVLPPDLGGEGPNITTLDWYHYLLETSQSSIPKTYKLTETTLYSYIPKKAILDKRL